jgi:hypothetical protein
MASAERRATLTRVLLVVGVVLLLCALVVGYLSRALFNSDQFANRATAALRNDDVRALVADRIADQAVRAQPDAIAGRPLISSAAEAIVGSRAFGNLFQAGVRDVHRAVFKRDEDTVTLTVSDVGTLLYGALQAVQPKLAKQLRDDRRYELLRRDIGSVTGDLARIGRQVRFLALVLPLLALAALAAAIWLAADRRRAVFNAGLGVAMAGALLVVALVIVRALVLGSIDDSGARAAAGGVWSVFLDDLKLAATVLAGCGAVTAGAAASLIRPVPIEARLGRAWQAMAREPSATWLRVVRALALVAAGVLVVAEPAAVVELAATLGGVYLIYKGVESILRLVTLPEREHAAAGEPAAAAKRPATRHRGRRIVAGAAAALLVLAAAGSFLATGGADEPPPAITACNGHRELCDMPLNEVVFPATHNSMSVPLPGWYSAMQEAPIKRQLQDGIRGLLIDTHYADKLPNGRVRTDLAPGEDVARNDLVDGLGKDARAAALRIRGRLGFRGKGKRGMFLCHTFCEIGASPLVPVLEDVRDFLVAHPNEVLVIVNQDAVTPADFVKAMNDAGLSRFAYTGRTSPPWPTLRQLIEKNQRLVVLAEKRAGDAPWYHVAYESIVAETPFNFTKRDQLLDSALLEKSCRPNRGPRNGSVFLMNHWVNTDPAPLASNARRVNAYGALLARARECERVRRHVPTLLAVDFYREGDLFKVADALNGVGAGR